MKKPILPFLIFILLGLNSFAQYQSPYTGESNPKDMALPKVYLSIGSGMQYKYGILGVGFGYRVTPTTIVEFNTGLGAYGTKLGLTGVFKSNSLNGWCPTIGYSRAGGLEDFNSEIEVRYNGNNFKTTTSVKLDPLFTLNAGLQRQFVTKSGNRFTIDLGYAIGLNKQEISFNEKEIWVDNKFVKPADLELSSNQKSIFSILGPSGLIIGFSYNFGFNGL